MVRGKMKLVSVTNHYWNPGAKTLRFQAEYDNSIPEDQAYAKATPTASIEMQVDNPVALARFELGKTYYVDFTPVPEKAAE